MNKTRLFEELITELDNIKQIHHDAFEDDHIFTLWFMVAQLGISEDEAKNCINGKTGDKGLDAIYINSEHRKIFLIQTKRRESFTKQESRPEILEFLEYANQLRNFSKEDIAIFTKKANPQTKRKIEEVANHARRGYEVNYYYVTLFNLDEERQNLFNNAHRRLKHNFEFFDSTRVLGLFNQYKVDAAPPIPKIELKLPKKADFVEMEDPAKKYNCSLFWVVGSEIKAVCDEHLDRLFSRNIRGYLGTQKKNSVNRQILDTIQNHPEDFFFINNGITIVCKDCTINEKGVVSIIEPSIVNGQQTARTLASTGSSSGVHVLVRVIKIKNQDSSSFDDLVNDIVAGTNRQNAISASDLMANDHTQVDLQNQFARLKINYVRKKGIINHKVNYGLKITKESLAQAIAGSNMDPRIVRSGKNHLFEESYYKEVFPNSNPYYYLPRYFLFKEVTNCAKGNSDRGYAKWLVLNFCWTSINPLFNSNAKKIKFFEAYQDKKEVLRNALQDLAEVVFQEAHKFFLNSGTELEISRFYRDNNGLHNDFSSYWNRECSKLNKDKFEKSKSRIDSVVFEVE